jgi:hypothetical protein
MISVPLLAISGTAAMVGLNADGKDGKANHGGQRRMDRCQYN